MERNPLPACTTAAALRQGLSAIAEQLLLHHRIRIRQKTFRMLEVVQEDHLFDV